MRLGIISKSFDNKDIVVLGEIYDKNIDLLQLDKDLLNLYPFTIIVKNGKYYYNKEDFEYYRTKYKITRKIFIKNKNLTKQTFRTPILVNLDTFEKIYNNELKTCPYYGVIARSIIGIMLPISNPVNRGNVLDQILLSYPSMIIVVGTKIKNNKNSTCILSFRYLRKKGYPKDRIIKMNYSCCMQDCLDVIDLTIPVANDQYKQNIVIGCEYSYMISLRNKIRDRKVFYRCPY